MEVVESHSETEVMTTWHNDESLANSFWQCFFATCLPETTNYEKLKIVCTDLDGIDRKDELAHYLSQFKQGWIPKK